MADRFDEIAAQVYEAAYGDVKPAHIAAALRSVSDESFEGGFECALDIAEATVRDHADRTARPPAVFGRDVTPAMRANICASLVEQAQAIRGVVVALRAARDRLSAEIDRARGGDHG